MDQKGIHSSQCQCAAVHSEHVRSFAFHHFTSEHIADHESVPLLMKKSGLERSLKHVLTFTCQQQLPCIVHLMTVHSATA